VTVNHLVLTGDALDMLTGLPDDSFHGMLTDPPYGLGFMGKRWDHSVPSAEVWAEALRVLKPGAYGLVFGGTRTWHRLAVALEDAGFALRDTLMWVYGSGFPKSHDVSKAIDRAAGAERQAVGVKRSGLSMNPNLNDDGWANAGAGEDGKCVPITTPATSEAERWDGYGTALKPAWEPILLVRKPPDGTVASNAVQHGTGGLNIDGCRVPTGGDDLVRRASSPDYLNKMDDGYRRPYMDDPAKLQAWHDRKVANQERATALGRWPANLIHDGSHEVLEGFPDSKGRVGMTQHGSGTNDVYGKFARTAKSFVSDGKPDEGSAARFFYAAKVSKQERVAGTDGNSHPTLKPIALTEYLARLILPPGDDTRILTPFAGAGSEMIGALKAGWSHATGIDADPEYVEIALARLRHWTGAAAADSTPLFAEEQS